MKHVAIITGVAGGIGKASALALARNGYHIVGMGRSENPDLTDFEGLDVTYVSGSIDVPSNREKLIEIAADTGEIRVLVNVAGVAPKVRSDLLDMTEESYDYVMGINTKGTINCTRAVLEDMKKHNSGSIINLDSVAGQFGTGGAAYVTSKAAVVGLTKHTALRFAGTGIRCNAIAPGFLVSAQNRALLFNEDGTPTARSAKILNGTPMNRFVDADELLGATLFLCDERSASAITGVVLPIDCGFAAYSGV